MRLPAQFQQPNSIKAAGTGGLQHFEGSEAAVATLALHTFGLTNMASVQQIAPPRSQTYDYE